MDSSDTANRVDGLISDTAVSRLISDRHVASTVNGLISDTVNTVSGLMYIRKSEAGEREIILVQVQADGGLEEVRGGVA